MKISKDLLNALYIESIYLVLNNILYLCLPLEIKNTSWFVSCDSDNLQGKVKLKVKYKGSFVYLNALIIKKEQSSLYAFTYEVLIDENEINKDNFKSALFFNIKEMEKKAEAWNRRKENRYNIGIDEKRVSWINFKSPEQIVVIDKIQLPCVVNNLSYSGANITTLQGNFVKDKKICLFLSFVKPIENISLITQVKNCLIKTTQEQEIVSIISVKFDNSPLEYKQRLDDFINILKEHKND